MGKVGKDFCPRRWNYHKLNTAKLTALAGELNWTETTEDESNDVQWANIKNVVLSQRDKTVPFVPAKASEDQAFALLMKYNTPAHLVVFNTEAARLRWMIRNCRSNYERRLAQTS